MQVEVPKLDGEGVREFVIAEWLKVGAYVRVAEVPALFADDPRVGTDEVDARVSIAVGAGWAPQYMAALLAVEYVLCPDGTVVRTKRAAALEMEPATAHPEDFGLTPVAGPLQLERYFAGW